MARPPTAFYRTGPCTAAPAVPPVGVSAQSGWTVGGTCAPPAVTRRTSGESGSCAPLRGDMQRRPFGREPNGGSGPVQPAAPLDPPQDASSESQSAERSFEVESRGGYARTIVGRVAYLDNEAQTYMVLTRDWMLIRVPLRDITSSHVVVSEEAG